MHTYTDLVLCDALQPRFPCGPAWFNTCFLQRWLHFRGGVSEVMLGRQCDIVQFEVRQNQSQVAAKTFMVCVTLSLTLHLSFLHSELFWKLKITWVPSIY